MRKLKMPFRGNTAAHAAIFEFGRSLYGDQDSSVHVICQ